MPVSYPGRFSLHLPSLLFLSRLLASPCSWVCKSQSLRPFAKQRRAGQSTHISSLQPTCSAIRIGPTPLTLVAGLVGGPVPIAIGATEVFKPGSLCRWRVWNLARVLREPQEPQGPVKTSGSPEPGAVRSYSAFSPSRPTVQYKPALPASACCDPSLEYLSDTNCTPSLR